MKQKKKLLFSDTSKKKIQSNIYDAKVLFLRLQLTKMFFYFCLKFKKYEIKKKNRYQVVNAINIAKILTWLSF